MLQVVSKSDKKAMVIISDPETKLHGTLHLKRKGNVWTDFMGTEYDLNSDEVDWFLFYRERLIHLLGHIRNFEPEDDRLTYTLAKRMAHEVLNKIPTEGDVDYAPGE